MKKLKIVLLYSGGLDSIGVLWQLLTVSNHEIFVQHLNIDCEWEHWEAEKVATDDSLTYMKTHCREFTVLPEVYYSTKYSPIYNPLCVFFGSLALLENNADRLYTANINGDNVPRIMRWWYKMGHPIFWSLTEGRDVKSERPFMNFYKNHWLKILPQKLIDMAMSCRRPIKQSDGSWKQCGTCNSCLELVESSNGEFPPDRKPDYKSPLPMFPVNTNRKKTAVLVSKCNNGMAMVETLLKTTDDFIAVQFIDIQNSNEENCYKESVEERLEELASEPRMITRLPDIITKTPFQLSTDPLTAMFSFCLGFEQYSASFDRVMTGEFFNADYDKLSTLYYTMLNFSVWEQTK